MKTDIEKWNRFLQSDGLEFVIDFFNTVTHRHYPEMPSPEFSFAHIVLDDYNLGEEHINFCLDRMLDWFYSMYQELDAVDYTSTNFWENYNWFLLVDYTAKIVEFLEWLKTIPSDIRY